MIPEQFAIRPLRVDDILSKFSLGKSEFQPLKTFLKKSAHDYERSFVGRTYVLVDTKDIASGGRVWGYLTLVASQVETTPQNKPPNVNWPHTHVPAVKLARMALDKEVQGKQQGRAFLDWAIALVTNYVCCHIGVRLLITDAKKSAVGFYSRMGFTLLDTPENKSKSEPVMFIVLDKLAPEK